MQHHSAIINRIVQNCYDCNHSIRSFIIHTIYSQKNRRVLQKYSLFRWLSILKNIAFCIISIALVMLIALTGIVMADNVVPQVPELQGFSSLTSISCEGNIIDSFTHGWKLTQTGHENKPGLADRNGTFGNIQLPDLTMIDNNGFFFSAYIPDPSQVHSTTSDANITAQHGQTNHLAPINGRHIPESGNIIIDGSAMASAASNMIFYPIGAVPTNVTPAYHTLVQPGSKYDFNAGSFLADDKVVGTDATVPIVLKVGINVKPSTVL